MFNIFFKTYVTLKTKQTNKKRNGKSKKLKDMLKIQHYKMSWHQAQTKVALCGFHSVSNEQEQIGFFSYSSGQMWGRGCC